VDRVLKPELDGGFLEIKSRTWSRRDAERKAKKISKLLSALDLEEAEAVTQEYTDLISS
jgi:5-methylthioadenosine/S-adenosylhomocysteine deaminase